MKVALVFIFAALAFGCKWNEVVVSDTDGLKNALSSASAGTSISLRAGTYDGPFTLEASGEPGCEIKITGLGTAYSPARITTGSTSSGTALTIKGSNVIVTKIEFSKAQKGVVVSGGSNNVVQYCSILNVGETAFTFTSSASGSTFSRSYVSGAGKYGVLVDKDCKKNTILGVLFIKDIVNTHIHVESGASETTISESEFTTTGTVDTNTIIMSKADKTQILRSILSNPTYAGSTIKHGVTFQSSNNFVKASEVFLYADGYGFYVESGSANTICKTNVVTYAGGATNVAIDPSC